MSILLINGSTRSSGSTFKFLDALQQIDPLRDYIHSTVLSEFPLFVDSGDVVTYPSQIALWQQTLSNCTGVIIATPEYIHNIPAVLKNALEWITASGELSGKPTLAITYGANPPRGEKAMSSLLNSLQALDANIVSALSIYKTDIRVKEDGGLEGNNEVIAIIQECLALL